MVTEGLVPSPSPERGRGRGRGCGEPPRQGQGRGRGRDQVLYSGPRPLRIYSLPSDSSSIKLRKLDQSVDAAAPPLPETAPKPPAIVSAHAEGVVIVEVGPNHRKYYLHKALVLFHSEYFRKALQGPWKEAEEGVVRLDDIESSEFNVFVHWLYNQQLPSSSNVRDWDSIFENNEWLSSRHHEFRIRAYVLGDRLLAPVFRGAVNNVIVSGQLIRSTSILRLSTVYQWAFANIAADRAILQFLVDDFCSSWYEVFDYENTGLTELPTAFVTRALRKYSQRNKVAVEDDRNDCCYCEHAFEAEAESCPKIHVLYDEKRECGWFPERLEI